MPAKSFDVIDSDTGVVLVSVNADTEYSGATIRFFDQWQTPSHLERFAQVLSDAATFLRDNGVTA